MAKVEAKRLLFSSYKEGSRKIEMIFVFGNSKNNHVKLLFKFSEVTNVSTRKTIETIWETVLVD